MANTPPGRARRWLRFCVPALMVFILLCALGIGWVEHKVDGYRREWQVEQQTLAVLREAGVNFGAQKITVGPRWLRSIAGKRRRPYFERDAGLDDWVEHEIDGYRREWQVEQQALAELREAGGYFSVSKTMVGPGWLREIAGKGRQPYFERVAGIMYVASDSSPAMAKQDKFKRIGYIVQE